MNINLISIINDYNQKINTNKDNNTSKITDFAVQKLAFALAYVLKMEEAKIYEELVHIPVVSPELTLKQHGHAAPNQSTPPEHENTDALNVEIPLQLFTQVIEFPPDDQVLLELDITQEPA